MNTSKAAVVVSTILGKIASILGYVVGLMSLIVILVGVSDMDSEGAIPAMIFFLIVLGLSVFLVIKGIQIKRRIKRFKRYVSLISTQHMTSLENLAASTSQSVDFVRNDLQKMINKRFFSNASIDVSANEIIIGGGAAPAPPMISKPIQAQTSSQSESETFTCAGCGASGTKTKGVPGICDYCGSVVK